jgi:hypothetical protein
MYFREVAATGIFLTISIPIPLRSVLVSDIHRGGRTVRFMYRTKTKTESNSKHAVAVNSIDFLVTP